MARIAHLTSVHPRSDVRILAKECQTIARAGHSVWLIVADGLKDAAVDNVRICDVGIAGGGRIGRMLLSSSRVLRAARRLKADIYHIHDPELLPVALALRRSGRVIYDAHEDVPRQIMGKDWINSTLRAPIARIVEVIENGCVRRIDAVVAATPTIEKRFALLGLKTATVCNFPRIEELLIQTPWSSRVNAACYIGGIALSRGLQQIVEACGIGRIELQLAGIRDPGAMQVLSTTAGWDLVHDLGVLDRAGVRKVLASVKVGIVTLLPEANIVESLPVKMFEYMAAGIPVVASNFPLWREIVEGNDCGLCVDPTRPAEIADAIHTLLGDDSRAEAMGMRGQQAVVEKFNWKREEASLLGLYESLLGGV